MNLSLPLDLARSQPVREAVVSLAQEDGLEERGAVFTRPDIVEGILDLCGYTTDRDLTSLRILEPAFGGGAFLLPIVERLIASSRKKYGSSYAGRFSALSAGLRAVEIHRETYERSRREVVDYLIDNGFPREIAERLVDVWLINDDFLLTDIRGQFDVVVGNPPYVRQERIPEILLREYKKRYTTLYDRADLYVLFYERGLDLLDKDGVLGFICANRWLKNRYGGALREKIAREFHLRSFIDLEQANAFHTDVIAYPAITIIGRARLDDTTLVALGHRDDASDLRRVAADIAGCEGASGPVDGVTAVRGVANKSDPWLLDSPRVLSILRALEARCVPLEQSGAKVGIGVATGADRVFIGEYDNLPVEPERKLKLVVSSDCDAGGIEWSGKGLVNPFLPNGELASFEDYPLFRQYLEEHGAQLKRRHVARKYPERWYRTIDRVYPDLVARPKLLIPDIKGDAVVSFDEGEYYPHHNLYTVTSSDWDLQALQAILRSSVGLMFVAAYGVRMAGGFLRFQAQYLRRIRVPKQSTIGTQDLSNLRDVCEVADQEVIDSVVLPLYGLEGDAAKIVRDFAEDARVRRA